ncbi:transmembrane protein 117 isoform X1 [Lingula anatina]|uniref:Transmembrane protein 117 isoform X1 n=1 Tax=Lingula anatina TaxID=7574 RepID=A0A1S3JAN1_LINAN|nr:transmembrane protein 117 isoform X1 [Lingula anatina]|eukprot:XP_013407457.1 transmembrane protein 117 isoform X1 [Lingula anatina]
METNEVEPQNDKVAVETKQVTPGKRASSSSSDVITPPVRSSAIGFEDSTTRGSYRTAVSKNSVMNKPKKKKASGEMDTKTEEPSAIVTGDGVDGVTKDTADGRGQGLGEGYRELDKIDSCFVQGDSISQFSLYMKKDFRYYFQHPYARLFVAYFVVFCNFLIYAEDPVAHSYKEATIPAIGNAFALVCSYYPDNAWSVLKVFCWMLGITIGIFFGKFVIHKLLLNRVLKLEMFSDDQGSWMIMFLCCILWTFVFSYVYNLFLLIGGTSTQSYALSGLMGINNAIFMKAAACGTWCGDFFTAWMVTDIMLQEKLYPGWATPVRGWWNRKINRIILFWVCVITLSIVVVMVIATDWINWDTLNRDFLPTNEVSRSFLASFILVMDLLIVMQDWDFPHFINNFDIKLPGLNTAHIKFEIPKCLNELKESWTVHITGKWFNYGILFIVMLLDLNMWKNQIFYLPADYGQYTDPSGHVYTVRNLDQLANFNATQLTYEWRSNNTDLSTNQTYLAGDSFMNSRYYGYHLGIKAIAFVPSLSMFITFGLLVYCFGRTRPNKIDVYGGRLRKRKKANRLQEEKDTDLVNVVSDEIDGKPVVVSTINDSGAPVSVSGVKCNELKDMTLTSDAGEGHDNPNFADVEVQHTAGKNSKEGSAVAVTLKGEGQDNGGFSGTEENNEGVIVDKLEMDNAPSVVFDGENYVIAGKPSGSVNSAEENGNSKPDYDNVNIQH